MMNRIFLILLLLCLVSCGNRSKNSDKSCCDDVKVEKSACESGCCSSLTDEASDNIVVYYMHGKQRCVTCKAIGTHAESVVKELGNDRVVIETVDFSTPEGEKIADKYEVASSSLILVNGDDVVNLTSMSFQYAKNDPEQFKKRLETEIQKMLE